MQKASESRKPKVWPRGGGRRGSSKKTATAGSKVVRGRVPVRPKQEGGELQLDEIWSFVYAKQKNIPTAKSAPEDAGDVWTWVAIDADSKLVPSWRIGDRSSEAWLAFVDDLAKRLANRVQITSDGHIRKWGGRFVTPIPQVKVYP